MDENLRRQRDVAVAELEALIRRGREIQRTRATDAMRSWQRESAAAIHQLSGGSKAHWLSRAFSNALLVRSSAGAIVVEADTMEIVERILGVLEQGAASLLRMEGVRGSTFESSTVQGSPVQGSPVHSSTSLNLRTENPRTENPRTENPRTENPRTENPRTQNPRTSNLEPRTNFDFVHNAELRPVLEQAFADSRSALERGEYALSLLLSCSVIESLLTDALSHARAQVLDASETPMSEWSFETRIGAAERAGLIRGGCARLPPVARKYRDLTDAEGELRADAPVSPRDARIAGQVLRVVMRDLNPGR